MTFGFATPRKQRVLWVRNLHQGCADGETASRLSMMSRSVDHMASDITRSLAVRFCVCADCAASASTSSVDRPTARPRTWFGGELVAVDADSGCVVGDAD